MTVLETEKDHTPPPSVAAFFPNAKPFWPSTPPEHHLSFDQISLVVNDLDAAMEYFCKLFGWGPFWPDVIVNTLEYKGEKTEVTLRVAFTMVGNIEVELMQPVGGSTPHHEYLQRRGEGFLHLRLVTDEIDAVLTHMARHDVKSIFEYRHDGEVVNAFVDSDQQFGVRAELIRPASQLRTLLRTSKFEWQDRGRKSDDRDHSR